LIKRLRGQQRAYYRAHHLGRLKGSTRLGAARLAPIIRVTYFYSIRIQSDQDLYGEQSLPLEREILY